MRSSTSSRSSRTTSKAASGAAGAVDREATMAAGVEIGAVEGEARGAVAAVEEVLDEPLL